MSDARIHDLGYRPYEGERAGVTWAMTSLGVHALRRVLGLKRAARHKVLPVIAILIAFVPAVVFVGMATFLPDSLIEEGLLPTYGEYYGFILTSIYLFASFVAPEAICTDRRTGMLALYLASPLDRTTYIVSKMAAVATALLLITLLPLLFLLVAYSIEGGGPDGIDGFVTTGARILAVGVSTAVYFAALTAAVSSFTTRRGIASAAIVVVLLIPGIVVGTVLGSSDAPDELALTSIAELPFRAAQHLLGDQADAERGIESVDGGLATLVTAAFAALFAALTWWRYQHIEVDR